MPFFEVLMSAERDRVIIQGNLQNTKGININQRNDMIQVFNENHVFKRLGLTKIDSEEQLRALVKPQHREFLYRCLGVVCYNQTQSGTTSVTQSAGSAALSGSSKQKDILPSAT